MTRGARSRRSAPAWSATSRLRPVDNAFAYPHLLPDAADAQPARAALRRAGAQPLRPAGLPRPRPRRRPRRRAGLARRTAAGRRHRRCRRRGLAADLPARARLRLQAGQLLVLPARRRLAGGDRGRGQQHLRRAPLLPAGRRAAGLRARPAARARCSTSRRSATSGRLPLPLHAQRIARRRALRRPHRPRRRRRRAAADQPVRPAGAADAAPARAPPSSACR